MKKKILLIITGPTAVGKTNFAIKVAQKLETEIISADSRQIYKEMRIGTARPDDELLKLVPHHMIACQSIHEYYNASIYETKVIELLNKLFNQYDVVILTGGSGLYIDAVCYGIDDLPTIDMRIRNQLQQKLKNEGIESLRQELFKVDPEYYKIADLANPKRILKALEVYYMTLRPYSTFLTRTPKLRDFTPFFLVLNIPRNELHQRINIRTDAMVQAGLLNEVKELFPFRHLNALNTVGYKEFFEYLEGKNSFEEAVELIKRNTRRYARRQITWFRKYPNAIWITPDEEKLFWQYFNSFLK